jgi:hypothetical protein
MDSRKKRLIGITVIAGVVLAASAAVALYSLFSASESTPPQSPINESVVTDVPQSGDPPASGDENSIEPGNGTPPQSPINDSTVADVPQGDNPPAPEGETVAEPGSGTLPELDVSGRIPASGEFDLGSASENVDMALDEHADEFGAVIEAIGGADASFTPEGYAIRVKDDSSGDSIHGSARVQLYIDGIATSSCYTVVIDDDSIQYVNVMWAYHPSPEEVEQILQLRSDFEGSAAGLAAIERTKAAMWPADSTATPDEYSEEYYFDFTEGRLYLTITDDRRQDGVVVAKQERIDCLEVLGR